MNKTHLKVVITDCDHGSIEEEKEEFRRIGAELVFARVKEEQEVIEACGDADGVIEQYVPITRKVLAHLPQCKAVTRYGIGVDTIDLRAATDFGIVVANVPDYCLDEVADQAMALLLGLIRKVNFYDRKVKSGQWDFRLGRPIFGMKGKIMGLIGCGNIGHQVAKRISAFGVRVIAFDPYIEKPREGVTLTDLDTLLRESDFISIHCSLNESTRHLLGEREFQKMKKKPILVNASRGPIVDENALIHALEKGLVSGAGLDVLEKEPPDPDNPLLRMDNVILTPHVSFYSEEAFHELKYQTARNISDVLVGKWPRSVVNPDVKRKTRASLSEP